MAPSKLDTIRYSRINNNQIHNFHDR